MAAIRGREEAVRTRLDAKQAELDQAVAELDVAKDQLEELRARLKRALVALRDRLVAMYETGSPDVLSVIVGSSGVDDLAARAEYLDRLHGMDEAVVGRVRDLRDQVQRIVDRLRDGQEPDRSRPRRDRRRRGRRWPAPAPPCRATSRHWSRARADRVAALDQIGDHEEELDGDVAAIQGKIAAQLSATGSMPLPAGPIQGGSGGLIWPVERRRSSPASAAATSGRYEYHPGIDIAVPEMTPIRAAAVGHRRSSPSRRRAAAATATTPASTTAAGSPPVTPTRPPSRSPPASRFPRATSSATPAAPATASAPTCISRFV